MFKLIHDMQVVASKRLRPIEKTAPPALPVEKHTNEVSNRRRRLKKMVGARQFRKMMQRAKEEANE